MEKDAAAVEQRRVKKLSEKQSGMVNFVVKLSRDPCAFSEFNISDRCAQ